VTKSCISFDGASVRADTIQMVRNPSGMPNTPEATVAVPNHVMPKNRLPIM